MKLEEMFDIKDDCPSDIRVPIEKYLEPFIAPTKCEGERNMITGSVLCDCGAPLDGYVGSFRYGMVHGEGSCKRCQRPIRANHYIKDDDGEDLVTFNLLLLYSVDKGEEA